MSFQLGKHKKHEPNIWNEAVATTKDTINSFLEGPIVAVETKDEYFEGLRQTRLSDPESWRKVIQNTPADDRMYLRDIQKTLSNAAKSGARNAFLYNFRSKICIYYDLAGAT